MGIRELNGNKKNNNSILHVLIEAIIHLHKCNIIHRDTVDGRHPAPVEVSSESIPLLRFFFASQVPGGAG